MSFPVPRILVAPELEPSRTSSVQLVQLAGVAGVGLDESQQLVSRVSCGVGPDGKWSAFEVVILAPRQNLKTLWSVCRILHGLFVLHEREIVYSAHQAKAASKMFRVLKRILGQCPQLGGRIARISNRLGSETIELVGGQSIECVARSTGSGRGFMGDLLILDEAHMLNGPQLADALPMLTARPNPQVVYLLSKGDQSSYHLARLRERALSGDPGSLAWIEWSLADDDNPADRQVWWNCNPGLAAGRIKMRTLEREFDALGPDLFAEEHLGRSFWPADPASEGQWQVFSQEVWEACRRPDDEPWLSEREARVPEPQYDPQYEPVPVLVGVGPDVEARLALAAAQGNLRADWSYGSFPASPAGVSSWESDCAAARGRNGAIEIREDGSHG